MKLLSYSNLKTIFTCFIIIASIRIHAQENYDKNITKSTLLSTACPGLGQAYNKKFWKIPIIYTSLGSAIYYYTKNNSQYQHYKLEYNSLINSPNTINSSGHNASNLITLQDYYRDKRDLSAFFFILLYTLNIVDACVDAHFMNYNVNDNLSLYLKPINSIDTENISLCLKFNL